MRNVIQLKGNKLAAFLAEKNVTIKIIMIQFLMGIPNEGLTFNVS